MSGAAATHSALTATALNVEGGAPTLIELIPKGPDVVGHDGRRWRMADAASVIAATNSAGRPLPIDWEHAGLIRAEQGLDAPAAGWIDGLEARDGAIWGRVTWTPRGGAQVANREYRFVSPVFNFDGPSGRITRLAGAGLTNNPNLALTAMNRREATPHTPKETDLDLAARLRQALGLTADAGDDAIVVAATTAVAANRAGVDLTAYAPRADLATAVNRADALQAELAAIKTREADAAIETALNAAQAEGKITPASRPLYLAMCKAEGGLANFTALAATLPQLAGATPTGVARKADPAPTGGAAELTAEQLAACKALGKDPVAYAKALKEDN